MTDMQNNFKRSTIAVTIPIPSRRTLQIVGGILGTSCLAYAGYCWFRKNQQAQAENEQARLRAEAVERAARDAQTAAFELALASAKASQQEAEAAVASLKAEAASRAKHDEDERMAKQAQEVAAKAIRQKEEDAHKEAQSFTKVEGKRAKANGKAAESATTSRAALSAPSSMLAMPKSDNAKPSENTATPAVSPVAKGSAISEATTNKPKSGPSQGTTLGKVVLKGGKGKGPATIQDLTTMEKNLVVGSLFSRRPNKPVGKPFDLPSDIEDNTKYFSVSPEYLAVGLKEYKYYRQNQIGDKLNPYKEGLASCTPQQIADIDAEVATFRKAKRLPMAMQSANIPKERHEAALRQIHAIRIKLKIQAGTLKIHPECGCFIEEDGKPKPHRRNCELAEDEPPVPRAGKEKARMAKEKNITGKRRVLPTLPVGPMPEATILDVTEESFINKQILAELDGLHMGAHTPDEDLGPPTLDSSPDTRAKAWALEPVTRPNPALTSIQIQQMVEAAQARNAELQAKNLCVPVADTPKVVKQQKMEKPDGARDH